AVTSHVAMQMNVKIIKSNGTSMIPLIIPPKDQISRVAKMLADEFGTASNIKSRQRLKLYNKGKLDPLVVGGHGVCVWVLQEGQSCALTALLSDDSKFGFIVMDGSGALFGMLQGNTREVLQKFTVDLPKKHGGGGQSALRFAWLRMEKRHNYVHKVAETAVQLFISNDKPSVVALILAGSTDFKTELSQSVMFYPRLQTKVLKIVDISYGGENGFNQAIELSQEVLTSVKFIQEKKLIGGLKLHVVRPLMRNASLCGCTICTVSKSRITAHLFYSHWFIGTHWFLFPAPHPSPSPNLWKQFAHSLPLSSSKRLFTTNSDHPQSETVISYTPINPPQAYLSPNFQFFLPGSVLLYLSCPPVHPARPLPPIILPHAPRLIRILTIVKKKNSKSFAL
uniref:Eukaryotic peptide chain release factor subunit 1 n=1 Tax=Eptatretus burgeri TaxID=7764 RepID=A0A8C4X066_EPTBU